MPKRKKYTPESVHRQIESLRGKYKPQPGEKPFAEWWAEYKAREKALEEAKYERCFRRRQSSQPG